MSKIQNCVTQLKTWGSGLANWLPLVLAAIAGLVALIYKSKAEKAETDAVIAQTQAKDAPLAAKQKEIEDKIKEVEHQDDSNLTPEERAKRWDK